MTKFQEACEAVDKGQLVTWKMFELVKIAETGEYKLKGKTGLWSIPGKCMKEDEWVIGKYVTEWER